MHSLRILVIEDEAIVARDISSSLERMGHVVVGRAATAEEALRLAGQTRPDVLLVDIRLPGELDGIDVVTQIREHSAVSVVYLTAYKDPQTVFRAKETNPDAYLLKPFGDDELEVTLQLAYFRRRVHEGQQEVEREQALLAEKTREAEQLRSMNRFRTEFINLLAHEVRTPMTPLLLELKVLEDAVFKRDEVAAKKALGILSRAMDRLGGLLEDVLAAARLYAGNLMLTRHPTDLAALVSTVAESHRADAERKGILLQVTSPGPLTVTADPERITQVLENFLSNAFKVTARGGRVTVQTSGQDDGVKVAITDTGIGFGADDRKQLFQPFGRLADEPHRDLPGAGLALYVSAGIVRLHDGRVWADSDGPGKGATFCLFLPGSGAAPPAPSGRPAPAGRAPVKARPRAAAR